MALPGRPGEPGHSASASGRSGGSGDESAPEDIDKLRRRITQLEQETVDLTRQLEERGDELAAARAANREMITRLNTGTRTNAAPGHQR